MFFDIRGRGLTSETVSRPKWQMLGTKHNACVEIQCQIILLKFVFANIHYIIGPLNNGYFLYNMWYIFLQSSSPVLRKI